ncbi:MAG: hypothetical protein AAB472_02065 [Patescibacteria group bacterium]
MIITVTTLGFEWRESDGTIHSTDKLHPPASCGICEYIVVWRGGKRFDRGVIWRAQDQTVHFLEMHRIFLKGRADFLEPRFFLIGDELRIELGELRSERHFWDDMTPTMHVYS